MQQHTVAQPSQNTVLQLLPSTSKASVLLVSAWPVSRYTRDHQGRYGLDRAADLGTGEYVGDKQR